jgi:hypothetical protein
MVYEFVYCKVPFGEEYETPSEVYEAVLNGRLIYPDHVKYSA